MKTFYYKKSIFQKIKDYFDPRKIKTRPYFQLRAYCMGAFFFAALFLILVRYAWLTLLPTQLRHRLLATGIKQFEKNIVISSPRATITDRNDKILAVSVPSPSLFLLTKKMPEDHEILKQVSEQIQVPLSKLIAYKQDKRNFVWLKRHMTPKERLQIGSLKKWKYFLDIVEEPKRIYPEKDLAAQLIGFTGIDGNGLEGIEKIYNSRLTTKPITAEVTQDARGRKVILTPNNASKPLEILPHLKLSIDVSIQHFTQAALKKGVQKAKAKGGSALVIDVRTGELLAIASFPTYDLNDPPAPNSPAYRFRPVMDAVELGSVVKPMIIAKALDLGAITPFSKFNVEGGKLLLPGGGRIRDDHYVQTILNAQEVLKYSSNIGMYKIVQKLGRERFYDLLMKVGFGRSPGTGFPGEWKGRIHHPKTWSEMRFANMSFGQGFAISPLQLAHALSLIVGGGNDRGVNFLALTTEQEKNFVGPPLQFISKETSEAISKMMGHSISKSKIDVTRISDVWVGGKTGTAQIWNPKENAYSGRTAVFEGILPAHHPKLAIVVVIDEAGVRPAYGWQLAGPVFSEISEKTVQYLNSQGVIGIEPTQSAALNFKERMVTTTAQN